MPSHLQYLWDIAPLPKTPTPIPPKATWGLPWKAWLRRHQADFTTQNSSIRRAARHATGTGEVGRKARQHLYHISKNYAFSTPWRPNTRSSLGDERKPSALITLIRAFPDTGHGLSVSVAFQLSNHQTATDPQASCVHFADGKGSG